MGVSTDGILFYGICCADEDAKPWASDAQDEGEDVDEEEEADARYARLTGLVEPTDAYPELRSKGTGLERTPTADEQAVLDKYHAFWAAKRERYDSAGVEVGSHCSDDCPMWYVAVSEAHITANRGYPQEIDPAALKQHPEWDAKIEAFCKVMGIPYSQPKWWLCSYWG